MPTGPVVPADDADGLPGAKTGRRLTAPGAEEADGAGAPLINTILRTEMKKTPTRAMSSMR